MTPCKDCPWSRAITPSARKDTLGGSRPEVYVGQIMLSFWLPCHNSPKYCDKASNVNEVSQCVGAATFRSNIGLTRAQIPEPLLLLPENHELVFSTLAEFYAHHKCYQLSDAVKILTPQKVAEFVFRQATDPNVRMQLKRRE